MGEDAKEYVKSIVDKVVREDLRELLNAPNTELAESLVRLVFKHPGQIMDYIDLSNELGVDRNTIAKYMKALSDAFIVRKAYSFSRNPMKVEKRKKKFYPYYATLLNYVHPFIPEEGLILETDVFEKLNGEYYYREGSKEVDLILPQCLYGIEVKVGRRITRNEVKSLLTLKWLKKRILVCPPTSDVKVKDVEVVYPMEVGRVDCESKT